MAVNLWNVFKKCLKTLSIKSIICFRVHKIYRWLATLFLKPKTLGYCVCGVGDFSLLSLAGGRAGESEPEWQGRRCL